MENLKEIIKTTLVSLIHTNNGHLTEGDIDEVTECLVKKITNSTNEDNVDDNRMLRNEALSYALRLPCESTEGLIENANGIFDFLKNGKK